MSHCEKSPFMAEFLQQVDALAKAFRNLPAEDYGDALCHIHDLLKLLGGSNETGTVGALSSYELRETEPSEQVVGPETAVNGRCSTELKEESFVLYNQARHAARKSRRKTARPRRCSELYEDDGEVYGCTRQAANLPKGDVVGCHVVKDFKGDERFQCDHCELKFSYYAALLRHLDSRHKTFDANEKIQEVNKKAVKCEKCGATLSSKGALHAHMQMHAGIQPFCCDVCDKRFSLKSNLLRHKRIHAGLKPYQCDICNKRFTEKRSVEVHRRIHTGERPYSCDVCGVKFSQLGSWMGHRDTHKDRAETKHECQLCDKKFTQKVGLHNHIKRHHEKKMAHHCTQCAACFYTPEELRIHTMSHAGDKPYLCADCGKSFSRQQTLKNHMRQHQRQETNYSCSIRPQTVRTRSAGTKQGQHHGGGQQYLVDGGQDMAIGERLANGELSLLPKDVLAVCCSDDVITSPPQDMLEVISRRDMFQ